MWLTMGIAHGKKTKQIYNPVRVEYEQNMLLNPFGVSMKITFFYPQVKPVANHIQALRA